MKSNKVLELSYILIHCSVISLNVHAHYQAYFVMPLHKITMTKMVKYEKKCVIAVRRCNEIRLFNYKLSLSEYHMAIVIANKHLSNRYIRGNGAKLVQYMIYVN